MAFKQVKDLEGGDVIEVRIPTTVQVTAIGPNATNNGNGNMLLSYVELETGIEHVDVPFGELAAVKFVGR